MTLLHSAMAIWNLSRADIVIKEFAALHVQNYRAFSTVLHAYIVEKLKKEGPFKIFKSSFYKSDYKGHTGLLQTTWERPI